MALETSFEKVCYAFTNGTCEECVANVNCFYCITDQTCRHSQSAFPSSEDCYGGLGSSKWLTCVMNFKFLLIALACAALLVLIFTASCTFYYVRRSRKRRDRDFFASFGLSLPHDDALLELTDNLNSNVGDHALLPGYANGYTRGQKSNNGSQLRSAGRDGKERAFEESIT